ncbi:MAG: hypothetical protein KC613_25895, partial [Myxococcales bacterium]|nr:hypothetical protein [Myxococcales bacterium]
LGMDDLDVVQTSDYVHLEARLGTPVHHICVISALDECVPDSEVAFSQVQRPDVFAGTVLGQVYVPSKSYFEIKNLVRAALVELFGDLVPADDFETVHLTPGRVHDVQCYSGALGLLDDAEARADGLLISAEPRGAYYVGFARVANLVSLAIDTLKLFVDFNAFGDQNDIAKAVSVCAAEALGPSLELADGTSREEWFGLLKTIQGCAIKQLGILLAKRGVYALAALVLDFAQSGGSGIVARITRSGMILDRVAGMLLRSPVQRQLIANAVDFAACAPCEDTCDAEGARRCAADGGLEICERGAPTREGVDGCLGWVSRGGCPDAAVCADGRCVACGGAGEACCALNGCDAGLGCDGGECVAGCRDTCPAVGATACADRARMVVCDEHDGDPCLEWGPAQACAVGEICEVDACAPPSCEDECQAGA